MTFFCENHLSFSWKVALFTFQVLFMCFSLSGVFFTFQVLFMFFSLFRCFSYAFHFSGVFDVLFTFHVLSCTFLFSCAFYVFFSCVFHEKSLFIWKAMLFMKSMKSANRGLWLSPSIISKTKHVCIHAPYTHTCTTCTTKHTWATKYHQNVMYLVGLTSVLYERPGQNEISVLNQLFLLLFRWF